MAHLPFQGKDERGSHSPIFSQQLSFEETRPLCFFLHSPALLLMHFSFEMLRAVVAAIYWHTIAEVGNYYSHLSQSMAVKPCEFIPP